MAGIQAAECLVSLAGIQGIKGLLDPLPFKGKGGPANMRKIRTALAKARQENREAMLTLKAEVDAKYPNLPWRLKMQNYTRGHSALAWCTRNHNAAVISLHAAHILPAVLELPPATRQLLADLDAEVSALVLQGSILHSALLRVDLYIERDRTMRAAREGFFLCDDNSTLAISSDAKGTAYKET